MSRGRAEGWWHRWGHGPAVPARGALDRLRRLDLLALAFGGAALLAPALFVLSRPLSPAARLTSLSVLLAGAGVALYLRRRFWLALGGELERRQRAEQEARAASLSKGQFLANASHEIRTPMNGVLGMADLLLGTELSATQREQVELIRTSAEALLTLVNDILDLSRIEAGRLLLRPRDFHLHELVGQVVRLLAPQAAALGTELRLHLAEELPDGLHGDPERLRQVLLNLMGNAIRFTHQGSVTLTIEAAEDAGGPALRFTVRDTGVGIPPEVQEKLFQPFGQTESAALPNTGGAGLGLVISKNIVELMGGEIGFESLRGAGSTFWFQVPRVAARDAVEPPRQPAAAASERARAARRGAHLLVVDDHPVNRCLAVAQLQELGFAADAAASGEAALARLAERRYDAVLLDCAMPGIDGYETCRRLRQQEGGGRRTPVIAVTAFAMADERERCLAAGMDDYLAKPYRGEELAALVDRWVGIAPCAPEDRPGGWIEERLAALQRLGETQGEAVLAQVVEAYCGRGARDLAAIEQALTRGDGEAMAAAAHSLGGSSGILGATALAASCAELETLARRGELAACAPRLQRVQREYHALAERLSPPTTAGPNSGQAGDR